MSVDLPAELSPTSPMISPGYSRRSTSLRARTAPNALLMWRISMIGATPDWGSGMFGLRFGAGEAPEAVSEAGQDVSLPQPRSEERRVGKEGRAGWAGERGKKQDAT